MNRSVLRVVGIASFSALGLLGVPGSAADETSPATGTGFTGTWALVATKDDVAAKTKKGGWNVLGGTESPGSVRTAGGGFDLPLEVMTDARRLVVTDDGGRCG